MRKCLLMTVLVALFVTMATFAWGQTIFWQDALDANNGWTIVPNWSFTGGALRLNYSPTTTNYDMAAISPDIIVPAAAGDLVISQYVDEYTGQGATTPETYEIAVLVNGTPTVLWTHALDSDWGVTGGQDLTLSLAPYSGQTIQLRFRGFGETTWNFDNWYIYDIKAYANLDQDMGALSVVGPTGPPEGSAAQYVVTVRNSGTTTAANYTVKLMKDGATELGSQDGTNLAPNATQDFTFSWTPNAGGAAVLTGQVIYAGDMNPNNNTTPPLNVDVQPAGTVVVFVGEGIGTQRQPMGVYWGFERDATLFTQDQLNQYGPILGTRWYCATTAAATVPYKIYMKTTNESTMTAATWDAFVADATLVKEGTKVFSEVGWHNFTFDAPYMYTGGNLIVVVETYYGGTGVTPYPLFRYSVGAAGQHMYWYNDTTPPTTAGTLNTNKPNIGIVFSTAGLASLNGTVTSNATPLAGATITIEATAFTTTTGVDGTYNFPYVLPGTYNVTAAKLGYNTVTQSVVLTADQASTQNFTLTQLPTVTVTGRVVGSDAPGVGIVDATIALTGYQPYTATTNATGYFTIPGVYANQTYNYSVTAPNYQSLTGTVPVAATNLDMGNLTIIEITNPPSGVVAEEVGASVNVTWNAPGTGPTGFTDGFEEYADFSLTFGDWILNDVDQSTTYGFTGITFPNSGSEMAYIIFNPATTTPALTGGEPHGGAKYAASFASETPPNNDWMITPQITGGGELRFWARSFTEQYGLERFKVGVSTSGTAPANFTFISGATHIEAPVTWTEYVYSLSAYAGQPIHVGINCVSNDAFIFFVDDFSIGEAQSRTAAKFAPVHTSPATAVRSSVVPNRVQIVNNTPKNNDRALVGYKVWRLLQGHETNEAAWTSLTANPIAATAYTDAAWNTMEDGIYKWAVKAVYTGGTLSIPAISNPVTRLTQIGTVAGFVRNMANQGISGATVSTGAITATTNANGAYSMFVPAGTHVVTAGHPNYTAVAQNGVVVVTGQTTTVNFQLPATSILLNDGFETYADFSLTFDPWVLNDVDQSTTYGFTGITFPNSGSEMAYIIFNPATTTPATTGAEPHGGAKYAACFASETPANNDWMITPQLAGGGELRFWARSFTADYGLERFKVGVSTTGTAPANFTFITGATHIEAPITWTEYIYNLSAYAGQQIRIGINCVSNDAFIFFVDDVKVTGPVSNDDIVAPVVATELKGNYPNPFNPETTIRYSMKEASPVSIEIYNVKGQLVKSLVNTTKESGDHTVVWNGTDNSGRAVTSGVYYYKMNAGKYSSTKKMIMMK